MKYIASCSCGKDSIAMVLTIIEKKIPLDYVIFFDTGKEFKSIYKNWEKLTEILRKNNIGYEKLQPSKSFDYEEDSYEYARKHKKAIEEYMRYED